MAHHFDCEVVTDGQPCGAPASFLYVNTFVKRLVCAAHAGEYRKGGKGGPAGVVEEVALLELIPSRAALQARLDRAIRVAAKYKAVLDSWKEAAGHITDALKRPWWQRLFNFVETVDIALAWQKTDEMRVDRGMGFPELGGEL